MSNTHPQDKEHVEAIEEKVDEKIKRRESKKRKRMPVSGKSVFAIKNIIENK